MEVERVESFGYHAAYDQCFLSGSADAHAVGARIVGGVSHTHMGETTTIGKRTTRYTSRNRVLRIRLYHGIRTFTQNAAGTGVPFNG
jgi:hypothetical protein